MDEDDKIGNAIIERIVWLATFLVIRHTSPTSGTTGAATSADEAVREFEKRFDPIIAPKG